MSHSAWMPTDTVRPELGVCITVGFLVAATEEAITVAQNLGITSENVGQFMNIPSHSITQMKTLQRVVLKKEERPS